MCHAFYVDFDIFHVGGPEFCWCDFPSNYTVDDNTSLNIGMVLCGVPQPEVQAKFIDQALKVADATINSYTHNCTANTNRMWQRINSNIQSK